MLQVNGTAVSLPYSDAPHGGITVSVQLPYVVFSADNGLVVKFDGQFSVFVFVPQSYSGLMCGVCGNFNGNPLDDYTTASGHDATHDPNPGAAVGDSFIIPDADQPNTTYVTGRKMPRF